MIPLTSVISAITGRAVAGVVQDLVHARAQRLDLGHDERADGEHRHRGQADQDRLEDRPSQPGAQAHPPEMQRAGEEGPLAQVAASANVNA